MTVLSSTTKHKKNEYAVRMPHKQLRKKAATIFIKIAAALRAESGTRTRDLFITNELLYQLSYFGERLALFLVCECKGRTFFRNHQMFCGFFSDKCEKNVDSLVCGPLLGDVVVREYGSSCVFGGINAIWGALGNKRLFPASCGC